MARIYAIILVSCIASPLAAPDTAATRETVTASAPTETAAVATPIIASESSSKTMYYGDVADDRVVRIVSTEYVDGTAVLVFESDLPWTVTVTAPTGSTSTGAMVGNLVRRPISPGRTTIRIGPPESWVTLVTSYFIENGRYTEIWFDNGGSVLIVDSFTGTDMRNATTGGVLDTPFDTLLMTVRQHFGLYHDMERAA